MECLRRVVNSNDLNPFLSLPRAFLNRKIEILITPVEDDKVSDSTILINNCIEDAKSRYKNANEKDCGITIHQPLLKQLSKISYEENPLISLRDDSIKFTMFYKGEKNIIDYKFNVPDRVYVTVFKFANNKRVMDLSEMKIEKLSSYFGAYSAE